MRHGPERGRKKRLTAYLERRWLKRESGLTSSKSNEQIAIEIAHARTGHHALCGIGPNDCEQCEAIYHEMMKKGRAAMLIEQNGGDPSTLERDEQAELWAHIYTTYLSGDAPRVGLLSRPQIYSDIAMIGDHVRSRAHQQALRDTSSGKTG